MDFAAYISILSFPYYIIFPLLDVVSSPVLSLQYSLIIYELLLCSFSISFDL